MFQHLLVKSVRCLDSVKGDRHRPCSHCGRKDHSGAMEDRKQNCPAYDKKCDNCDRFGHFKKKCLWKARKNKSETAEIKTEEPGVN